MSKEANILDIIQEGIIERQEQLGRPMVKLQALIFMELPDNVKLSENSVKLLKKIVDDFSKNKISNDEFERQAFNILLHYTVDRGSKVLQEKYRKKPDFSNVKPIIVRTSPEIEKAMEEHRKGRRSGLSRLFTPSPDSGNTPSPPTITDRIPTGESKGEPTKFGDTPSPLLRPNPRRDTGTLGLNSIGRSINVGQPKDRGQKTPLLKKEDDDYDPDNCSDCEGGCCGGRKRKTRKRKKRKTRKRKKRKNRTKRRKKRTRKQKGGGLLEILGFGRSSNSTSDTLREIAQNQLSEQKTLTVTPQEAKNASNDGFQLLDSNQIQEQQDAEKEQKRREANRTFYVESAQQDWDDINTSIKRIYPSGGEGNPFQPNIGPRPNNFETAKYFKEKLLEEAKRQANIHGGRKRRKKTKRTKKKRRTKRKRGRKSSKRKTKRKRR